MASKTVKVIVTEDFFDLKENVMRSTGEEMEVTKERLEQIQEFVNNEKSKA
ncbi:hypothetical protein JEQ21_01815 [Streptococcus sp. 121]|uniref:hypothetical protein n=1 Tax=Streptococcus sp. 121 TaxID=2797637 RepID=UPI0018F0A0C2|nr:hypothetical protein [Streptococcus sp. 121]MBJ6745208.1 hypothetical protein [Streptococcus sp. 121]